MNRPYASVLVVDDDEAVAEVMASLLEQVDYSVRVARSGAEAVGLLREGAFDAVISDIRMPPPDGVALTEIVQSEWPDVAVLLVTAFATVPLAVEAMKKGAADFIMKPFDREQLLASLRNALAARASLRECPPENPERNLGIVGDCDAMRAILRDVERAAQLDVPVLIQGESGTGKGLIARAIHDASQRSSHSFVRAEMSSLPDALMESELFGRDRRAGASSVAQRVGRAQLADGGTLFLDNVADASPAAQASLLGLCEELDIGATGGTSSRRPNVRLMAATHRDLKSLVRAEQWRADLYYRLNVVPIVLPPLRERGKDAALIAHALCARLSRTHARPVVLEEDAALALCSHDWPGNVRQLTNLMERLALFSPDGRIRLRALQGELERAPEPPSSSSYAERRRSLEREELTAALARTKGNRSEAARLLGVSRRTLYSRLKAAGISHPPS